MRSWNETLAAVAKLKHPDAWPQTRKLKKLSSENWFRFMPRVPELWVVDRALLIRYTDIRQLDDHHMRTVRCSVQLDAYLDQVAPPSIGGLKDAVKALNNLMEAVAPGSPKYVE